LQCVAVCCNVLQQLEHLTRAPPSTSPAITRSKCVAVRHSALQCVAECCSNQSTFHIIARSNCIAVCCSALQCVAVCCSALQCVAVRCSVLQCVSVVLQQLEHLTRHCQVEMCCSVLQCLAATGALCRHHQVCTINICIPAYVHTSPGFFKKKILKNQVYSHCI